MQKLLQEELGDIFSQVLLHVLQSALSANFWLLQLTLQEGTENTGVRIMTADPSDASNTTCSLKQLFSQDQTTLLINNAA